MTDSLKPATLVMLLSMAKLQKGSRQAEEGVDKRWQTPEDVVTQILEAKEYLKQTGQSCSNVILLYTNSLYHNNDTRTASQSHVENHKRASAHKAKTTKLLARNGIAPAVIYWDELLKPDENFEKTRTQLTQRYQTDNMFRLAVQNDNPKRVGVTDAIPAKIHSNDPKPVGSPPEPSDQFVIEEANVFKQLAQREITHCDIDPDSKIVLCYPGPMLQSLDIMLSANPVTKAKTEREFAWLDVADLPQECSMSLQPLWQRYMTSAASILLPVLTGAMLSYEKPVPLETMTVKQNDYQITLLHTRPGRNTETVVFHKWDNGFIVGAEVGYTDSVPTRPAYFQGDIGLFNSMQKDCNRIVGQTFFDTACDMVDNPATELVRSGTYQAPYNGY